MRFASFFLAATVVFTAAATGRAQGGSAVPPSIYELIINGESFTVEANLAVKLQSKQKPGTSYQVALRVAPTQRLKLNSVQFQYDWLARVEDDRNPQQRSVRLTHELGYTMLITDLGGPLKPEGRDKTLKILAESVTKTYREMKPAELTVSKAHERKFAGAAGRGVAIRYRDKQELRHTCLVYVLTGPEFAASCIIQYLDDDFEEVKPLILDTLNSFRAVR